MLGEEVMSEETVKSMDPNILLSLVNMKLRDFYGSLECFCTENEISKKIICEKLKTIGYSYNGELNQFRCN